MCGKKDLGHQVTVSQAYDDGDYGLLVAAHARRELKQRAKNRALRAPERVEIVALKSGRPMIQTRGVNESARALQFSTI